MKQAKGSCTTDGTPYVSTQPIVAVRIIVPDADGKVLLLRRQRTAHGAGAWCLPGGKVIFGDTVDRTVTKELMEETGLTCNRARFLFYQDSLPSAPDGMHYVNLYFECVCSGAVMLNPESSTHAWVGPTDAGNYKIVFRNDAALTWYWERMRQP